MSRILLADDDTELTGMLREYLGAEGFAVETAADGAEALEKARAGPFDLLVLDVMMPRVNGFDVLRALRAEGSRLPVLMLTARGDDVDSVVGLELGADDYLPKPCNPRVLAARVRAVLRRAGPEAGAVAEGGAAPGGSGSGSPALEVGDLVILTGARRVTVGGVEVALTSTEYAVLEVLVRGAGEAVAKAALSERALGRRLTAHDRSLDMHVSALRRKLGPLPDGTERIVTVRGTGYQYVRQ